MNLLTKLGLLTIFLGVVPTVVSASITDGTLDPAYNNLVWSENVGWINFNPPQGNVQITDDGMAGYAWSDAYGWINLAPVGSGVRNDGEGHLSGYAWGENLGWIGFSGVTIGSDGIFHGMSTGDVTGTINFDCSSCHVVTDWRPRSVRTTTGPGSGGGAAPVEIFLKPVPPSGGFTLLVNGVAGTSIVESRTVTLTLNAGADVDRMAISNTSDFAKASLVHYIASTTWDLCSYQHETIKSKECKPGTYHIYAKFYTKSGLSSDPIMATVILRVPSVGQILPIQPDIQETPSAGPELSAQSLQKAIPTPVRIPSAVLFTRSLELGDKHAQVQRLQQFLNVNGFIVSQKGFGSPGHETNEFGRKTYQSLVRFQKANIKQIFTSRPAVKNDFGRFGPLTRKYVNSLIGADVQK